MLNILILLSVFLSFSALALNPKITVVTEHFPPYQIANENRPLSGQATEFVRALLVETSTKADIKVYPWARAYSMALNEPNVLIFSISRTQSREKKFHWVGSYAPLKSNLWALEKNKSIEINSLSDIKQYKIAVPRSDTAHHILNDLGFTSPEHLYLTTSGKQALKMLLSGRVDLTAGALHLTDDTLEELNINRSQFKNVYKFENYSKGLSIAFSKSTPLSTVKKFRAAFKKLQTFPSYADLFLTDPEPIMLAH